MTNKAWGGRFSRETDELMLAFSESVSFDRRLAEADIEGSIAHARMLGARGIIGEDEADILIKALEDLLSQAREGKLALDPSIEDVHMNVEALLKTEVGELAGKLHTARSRNDQVALDMRMYFRGECDRASELLTALLRALAEQAEKNIEAVMPGFTHTRKAQPVLFSHHLMAYAEMFLRDRERLADCRKRINLCPLGSGAFAGTTFDIDRDMVAKELGFEGVTENSVDAVSDRDYLIEFGSAAAVCMVHLSRLMEELIWWGLPEIGFVELPEEFCTGSSMMPNKKNPDAAELIRGKTGRVIGALVSIITVMKGTPLAYNRDFQEDKEGMFDAADTLKACLAVAGKLVAGMRVDAERMKEAGDTGFVLATDLADYLAEKGMPFREAHNVVGRIVARCEKKGIELAGLSLQEMKEYSELFDKDVKDRLDMKEAVKRRDVQGGTAPGRVKSRIARLKKLLEKE